MRLPRCQTVTVSPMRDCPRASMPSATGCPSTGLWQLDVTKPSMSAGTLVVELQGSHAPALLSRLVDASALPAGLDQASRVRLADIAAVVWREAPDRFGLLVDRAHGHYLARWLSYAADAI